METHEIDYTYLVSELQDAQGELEQHHGRLERLERAVRALTDRVEDGHYPAASTTTILETPVSEFIDK